MRLLFNSAVAVGTLAVVDPLGAWAFPGWSGNCLSGRPIPAGIPPHEGATASTKSVEDLNLVVKMALQPGVSLGGVVLDPGNTETVVSGESYFLTIDGSGTNNQEFKGFLFRLSDRSSGGVNVANDLVIPENPERKMQKLESTVNGTLGSPNAPPTCAEGVAGICHSASDGTAKSGLQASIDFNPSSAGELLLEITVVINKAVGNWGHSAYNFTVGSSAPSSSPAPSPPSTTKAPVAPTSGGNTITNKIPFIVAAFTTGMAWLFF